MNSVIIKMFELLLLMQLIAAKHINHHCNVIDYQRCVDNLRLEWPLIGFFIEPSIGSQYNQVVRKNISELCRSGPRVEHCVTESFSKCPLLFQMQHDVAKQSIDFLCQHSKSMLPHNDCLNTDTFYKAALKCFVPPLVSITESLEANDKGKRHNSCSYIKQKSQCLLEVTGETCSHETAEFLNDFVWSAIDNLTTSHCTQARKKRDVSGLKVEKLKDVIKPIVKNSKAFINNKANEVINDLSDIMSDVKDIIGNFFGDDDNDRAENDSDILDNGSEITEPESKENKQTNSKEDIGIGENVKNVSVKEDVTNADISTELLNSESEIKDTQDTAKSVTANDNTDSELHSSKSSDRHTVIELEDLDSHPSADSSGKLEFGDSGEGKLQKHNSLSELDDHIRKEGEEKTYNADANDKDYGSPDTSGDSESQIESHSSEVENVETDVNSKLSTSDGFSFSDEKIDIESNEVPKFPFDDTKSNEENIISNEKSLSVDISDDSIQQMPGNAQSKGNSHINSKSENIDENSHINSGSYKSGLSEEYDETQLKTSLSSSSKLSDEDSEEIETRSHLVSASDNDDRYKSKSEDGYYSMDEIKAGDKIKSNSIEFTSSHFSEEKRERNLESNSSEILNSDSSISSQVDDEMTSSMIRSSNKEIDSSEASHETNVMENNSDTNSQSKQYYTSSQPEDTQGESKDKHSYKDDSDSNDLSLNEHLNESKISRDEDKNSDVSYNLPKENKSNKDLIPYSSETSNNSNDENNLVINIEPDSNSKSHVSSSESLDTTESISNSDYSEYRSNKFSHHDDNIITLDADSSWSSSVTTSDINEEEKIKVNKDDTKIHRYGSSELKGKEESSNDEKTMDMSNSVFQSNMDSSYSVEEESKANNEIQVMEEFSNAEDSHSTSKSADDFHNDDRNLKPKHSSNSSNRNSYAKKQQKASSGSLSEHDSATDEVDNSDFIENNFSGSLSDESEVAHSGPITKSNDGNVHSEQEGKKRKKNNINLKSGSSDERRKSTVSDELITDERTDLSIDTDEVQKSSESSSISEETHGSDRENFKNILSSSQSLSSSSSSSSSKSSEEVTSELDTSKNSNEHMSEKNNLYTTPITSMSTSEPLIKIDYCNSCYFIGRISPLWTNDHINRLHGYCAGNCKHSVGGYCPPNTCKCGCDENMNQQKPEVVCEGVGLFKRTRGIDDWCLDNCLAGHCPSLMCKCKNL